jgi:hypothetical protein
MDFNKFNSKLRNHVKSLLKDVNTIFEADLSKDELWDLYLSSFPAGTNEIFRVRREYDCGCCRSFVKNFGGVIVVKDGKKHTIWDFNAGEFQPIVDALSAFVKAKNIGNVFITKFVTFGTEKSLDGNIIWNHFNVTIDDKFKFTQRADTIGTLLGTSRTNKEVFKRSLEEISLDAIQTVNELISQNSLYKGEEWKGVLAKFTALHKAYSKLNEDDKDVFLWTKSIEEGPVIGRIKNHSIGVLLQDITSGTDLDEAVRKYEAIVAPTNYKRPKAIFTKKMVEDAEKMLTNEGLIDSLPRRFARISDITVNNILFANRDAKSKMAQASNIFDDLKKETKFNPKSLGKIEEITVEKFVSDVLPNASSLEVLFEGRHSSNLVSLIAPKNKDSKSLFKWDNGFSWAYNGNITDSMKERVKSAGGKVDGVLRFSIQWNTEKDNHNDYDAHCIEPGGNEIYFSRKVNPATGGNLDVDIIHPTSEVAVENITWPDIRRMRNGQYKFIVHNYCHRGGKSGFSAEIEFNGELYSFEYNKDVRQSESIEVAVVELKDGNFKIVKSLDSTMSSKEIWGIKTNDFVNVSVCMYSPNHWDEQGVGNRHYMFMLADCVNDTCPNGFFNEFIREEYMKHKRVFEALGSKMSVEPDTNQLSGVGFSSTKRNNVIVRVGGAFSRILSVKI